MSDISGALRNMSNVQRIAAAEAYEAEIQREMDELRARQFKPAMRMCMCGCKQQFLSSWAGERYINEGKDKDHRKRVMERDHPLHWWS